MMDSPEKKELCAVCGAAQEICTDRIKCRAPSCDVLLCVTCFSQGKEIGNHRNDHPYAVLSAKYPVLQWDWSGADEMKLLDAVETCGFGNWNDISRKLGKESEECKTHYIQHYLYGEGAVHEKSILTANADSYLGRSRVAYYQTSVPPRPELGSSDQFENLAGYMAPRADFSEEPDSNAERIISNLSFADLTDEQNRELQLTIVDIYRRRLQKRVTIKNIVADHGLLDVKQNTEWFSRYAKNLREPNLRLLLPLVQVTEPDSYMFFMESLNCAEELRNRIELLKTARENGLKTLMEVSQFQRLQQLRKIHRTKPSFCREVFKNLKNETSLQKFLQRKFREEVSRTSTVGVDIRGGRRKKPTPAPLCIENLQGYHKLSQAEKEFCSTLRLFPTTFLNMKSQLLSECRRGGGIRLSRARAVCNIDVNKTKKLYEFLISQDVIHR